MTLQPGNPMRVVLLSILLFEMVGLRPGHPGDDPGLRRSRGVREPARRGAALLALVAAALLRRPAGYLVGWLTQPVGVVLGFLTSSMFFVGGMFFGLWLISFILGKRLDGQATAPAS